MHIGIDASRAAYRHRTGTENYSLHLSRALLELDSAIGAGNEFTLYFSQEPAPGLFPARARCRQRVLRFPRLWTHVRLSAEMALHRPDVLFVPAHVLPLVHPRRSVVTIHDLGYIHYPRAHRLLDRFYLRVSTRWNARHAAHVLVDSGATKRDVVALLRVDPARVTVVYPGLSPNFAPASGGTIAAVRQRYSLESEYVLYVGTVHPRKNLLRLVRAFSRLQRQGVIAERLVIAGKRGWLEGEILQAVREAGGHVTVTGFVPEEDLPALMSGARLFAIPSLFEGFGLPALEAMACGAPVLAAYGSSLPEVVGEAGVLVDPRSEDDIADGMARVLTNEALRQELRLRGLQQATRFTWEEAAQKTLAVLEEVGEMR